MLTPQCAQEWKYFPDLLEFGHFVGEIEKVSEERSISFVLFRKADLRIVQTIKSSLLEEQHSPYQIPNAIL